MWRDDDEEEDERVLDCSGRPEDADDERTTRDKSEAYVIERGWLGLWVGFRILGGPSRDV